MFLSERGLILDFLLFSRGVGPRSNTNREELKTAF